MKFYAQNYAETIGDQRVVTRFLWWPVRIGGETRWLEWASWLEEVCITYADSTIPPDYRRVQWLVTRR